MWFHNKNRYQTPMRGPNTVWRFWQKFGYYFARAGCTLRNLAAFPECCAWACFMHYLLDSKIWRVRGDKELAAALQM